MQENYNYSQTLDIQIAENKDFNKKFPGLIIKYVTG